MQAMRPSVAILIVLSLLGTVCDAAEDERTQYPKWLLNSFIDVNVGYIDYNFSQNQLEPNYKAGEIRVPHIAVRLALLGYNFSKNFSAQVLYMRPVQWVKYTDINGTSSSNTAWMNLAGLTLRSTVPLKGSFSIYLEGGLGIVTRNGFSIDGHDVVKNANYATILLGAGIKYHLNKKWDLQASAIYSPSNNRFNQPSTLMLTTGAVLNLRSLSTEQVRTNGSSDAIFPKNLIQVGYATNKFGTDVNHFVAGGAIPIFWGGSTDVARGSALRYQRNVFHTKKIFSLDLGASISNWQSNADGTRFLTVSIYPQFRFTLLRFRAVDFYLNYSVAGPTFISKSLLDGHNTGRKFTFQDLMGLGCYIGKERRFNFEVSIGHYSNGNLFPNNAGVKIPLTFSVGYTF